MDPSIVGGEPVRGRERLTALVTRNATLMFHDRAPEALLRRWSAEAVGELWRDGPKVTAFVPALALRGVRERLRAFEAGREAG